MKLFYLILFISMANCMLSQEKCNTDKLLTDLVYHQFGGQPTDYILSNVNDYIKCKNADTINMLLLSLINLNWKSEYINTKDPNQFWDYDHFSAHALELGKQNNNTKSINDSLYSTYIMRKTKDIIDNTVVSNFNIKLCGYLNIKESISVLNKALINSNKYNSEIVILTLAKLGDTSAENKICNDLVKEKNLSKIRDFHSTLDYVRTKKIIHTYSEFLKNNTEINTNSNGVNYPVSYTVLTELYNYVLNEDFVRYVKYEIIKPSLYYKALIKISGAVNLDTVFLDNNMIEKTHIQYMINWFEKNKEEYILK